MKSSKYRYPYSLRIFTILLNVLGFAYPVYRIARFTYRAYSTGDQIPFIQLFLFIFLSILFWAVLIFTANYFPEVIVEENGVKVKFIWRFLFVSWSEILSIKPKKNFVGQEYEWVVITQALTPFHRLYGVLNGKTANPSFIIYAAINKREELLKVLENRKG